MANEVSHLHRCCHCGKLYNCDLPECASLEGYQRMCNLHSYLYGWRQRQDRDLNDWSAL